MSSSGLKQQRGVIKAQVTKMKQYIDSRLESANGFELETKLGMLETYLTNFNNIQSSIEQIDEAELRSTERESFEESYFQIKSKLLSGIKDRASSSTTTPSTTTIVAQVPTSNLPILKLTSFSGDLTKCLDFWGSFKTAVHLKTNIKEVDKLQHLKNCLTGPASKILQSLELLPENYDKAIDRLTARYYNKRYIYQAHINQIFQLQGNQKASTEHLHDIADSLNAHMNSLLTISSKEQIADGLLIHILFAKIDNSSHILWEEEVKRKQSNTRNLTLLGGTEAKLEVPTWNEFADFLEERCQTLEQLDVSRKHMSSIQTKSIVKHSSDRKPTRSAFSVSNNMITCSICAGQHTVFKCEKFSTMTPQQRFNEAKRLNLCINCLRSGHVTKSCNSKHCQTCGKAHHTLLHFSLTTQSSLLTSNQSDKEDAHTQQYQNIQTVANDLSQNSCRDLNTNSIFIPRSTSNTLHSSGGKHQVLLATAIVKIRSKHGNYIPCRTMLDGGSQLNFLTEKLASYLELPAIKAEFEFGGICNMNTRANKVTTVKIQSLDNNWSSNLEVVIVPSITSLQPSRYFATNGLNIPKNVKLADPAFNRPQKIDMLIGASHFFELLSVGQIKLGNIADSMILQKTTLGWIVAGNLPLIAHSFCISTGEQNTLNDTLKSFWELEEVQSKPLTSRSEEESQCENHFIANTIRNHEGRYVVKLPFREPSSTLGTSFEMALHRFQSLERKFGRDLKLHLDYSQFINEYIELEHLEEVEPYIVSKIPNKFFLPHHAVMKEESSTTKLRVVFDGSAKSSSGKSINDILMVGPTIQDDLFSQLFRFRLHKHVLCADIAKMYRQVLVDKQDTNYQYILWRNNPSEDIKYFRLSTVTYGTSPASFLAIRSLVQLAKDEGARFPLGAKAILNDFYVDNLMTGADNIDDLKSIKEQTHALLALGGFPLRKWCFNTPTLLHGIPLEDREQILEINDSPFIKTLGVKWNPNDDAFFYTYTSNESKKRAITKRTVLSDIGTFFDPLGLLNPVVVSAKLLLQHLWKLKLNWDESLPQELHSKWTTFLGEMSHLNTLKIPRYVMHFNNNYSDFQVHGFSDASEKAYGAAIYLRITDDNGKIFVHLLCSKSRVAPTNTVSLPRLELCGALLLSELLHRIIPLFKPPINTIFCWTDSTITLTWINSQSYQWKTFIANRITKIHDLTKSYSWRYVPTRDNPAALVSRGASAKDLATSNLWFNGPNFLLNSHDSWPANKYSVKELPEQKEQKFTFAAFTNQEDLISINKFANSYFRLISVFAYVLRFISKCRPNSQECNRKNRDTNIIMNSILLRPDELEGSLQALIRMVQSIHFPEEQAKLNSKQQIKSSSNLIKLSPFIDSEGIIRVGGRLRNADLNFESKHPIVLPSNHSFTRAIIWYYHIHHHHPACQTLVNILRQKYWILSGKRAVNGEIRKCVTCFRARPASTQQIMGNLPADRVTCSRPFAITGVDYCGPFYIRSGIRGKLPSNRTLQLLSACPLEQRT